MCCIQDIEALVDWFGAVIWGGIRMSNSPIDGSSASVCPVEFVEEEVCYSGTFIAFL